MRIPSRHLLAFGGGGLVGALGGLIGLGGAELRLPLLIGPFRFAALDAVILNKAISLVVVASALIFRTGAIPFETVAARWPVILNLLAGSVIGAWFGAGWTFRLKQENRYRVIAVLLVAIAVVLAFGHGMHMGASMLTGTAQTVAGVLAGFALGARQTLGKSVNSQCDVAGYSHIPPTSIGN